MKHTSKHTSKQTRNEDEKTEKLSMVSVAVCAVFTA